MENFCTVIVTSCPTEHHRKMREKIFNASNITFRNCTNELIYIEQVSCEESKVLVGLIFDWVMAFTNVCGR
jgi:hypothetical protein